MNFIDTGITKNSLNEDKENLVKTHPNSRFLIRDTNDGLLDVILVSPNDEESYKIIKISELSRQPYGSLPTETLKYQNLELAFEIEGR